MPGPRVACVLALAQAALRDTCGLGSIVKYQNPAYWGQQRITNQAGAAEWAVDTNEEQEQIDSEAGHRFKAEVVAVNRRTIGIKWIGQSSPHANTVAIELVKDMSDRGCWVAGADPGDDAPAAGGSQSGNLRGDSGGGGGGGSDGGIPVAAIAGGFGGLFVIGGCVYMMLSMQKGSDLEDYNLDEGGGKGFTRKLTRQMTNSGVARFTRSLSQKLGGRTTRTEVKKYAAEPPEYRKTHGNPFADIPDNEAHAAATKLQAAHRGKQGRQRVDEMHGAATKLQSAHRGKVARRQVEEMKDDPQNIVRAARREVEQRENHGVGGVGHKKSLRNTHNKNVHTDLHLH